MPSPRPTRTYIAAVGSALALGAATRRLSGQVVALVGVLAAIAHERMKHAARRQAAAGRTVEESTSRGRTLTDQARETLRRTAGDRERRLCEQTAIHDEFLARVSHELRAPLSAIRMWTSLLRSGRLGAEESHHALEVIERGVAAQARLIDDLLDLSWIVSGKVELTRAPVDLGSTVRSAVEALLPTAAAAGIALEEQLLALPVVSGDAARLQQVISNLLSNAVKFTPRGGAVEVTLDRLGGRARITVRDTGQGIPPDVLPHVFERFRQGERTSTREHGGLGLGLAVVHRLVSLHGGRVEAASRGRGRGATFTVTLPVTAGTAERTVAPRPSNPVATDPASVLDGVRVLVVEDDADARESILVTLEQSGAQARAVDSVAAALDALREEPPDVVVSDIAMPEADGYVLMRRLHDVRRSPDRPIPAIALTAHASARDRQRILAAGFRAHLAKPADPGTLVETVASVARGR